MSEFIKKNITKTKCKKKKVKAFHQKVKVFRATDPKMAVVMWGVSQSVCSFILLMLGFSESESIPSPHRV